ncbi:MAG: pilin [Candidatus Nomurabacteria bacterium]|jgi:ABC-type Fe3+ transport system permease subunit|nr:pilin [Candidatus Nomurabacteria bacterium]
MKQLAKRIGLAMAVVFLATFSLLGVMGGTDAAADTKTDICDGVTKATGAACDGKTNTVNSVWGMAGQVVTWMLIAVGIICVVFIIIGGIKFTTSGGDPEKAKSARKTLLFAIIGLAVCLLATLIVNLTINVSETLNNTTS